MMLIDLLDLYALQNDSDDLMLLFNDYVIDSRIDKTQMNKIIIKELGNARPFSNNTRVFKFALEEFFGKYQYNIGKLIDTMYYEYSPIDNINITKIHDKDETEVTNKDQAEVTNKDQTEDISKDDNERKQENNSKNISETEHRESTGDIDNTDSTTETTSTHKEGNDENEQKVSAYDSSSYQPKQKDERTTSEDTTGTKVSNSTTTSDISSTVDTAKTITEAENNTATRTLDEDINRTLDEDINRNLETDITETTKGKDSEHTYQELIAQERELAEFNIFNWIIKQMRKELFLLVY